MSGAMLALLVSRVHIGSLLPSWRLENLFWLTIAIAITLAGVVLAALRWQRVLFALGHPIAAGTLVAHYFAGLFVGNFLPSTIVATCCGVKRLTDSTGDGPDSFASVVLERLTGWLVLPVISLIGLAINPSLRNNGVSSAAAFGLSVGTLVGLVGILTLAASPRLGGRLAGHPSWLRFIGAVHLGLERFRRHPVEAMAVLVVGFAYQFLVVVAAFAAAEALEIKVGFTAILAFMPVVAMAQVIPIGIGGLGWREGAFYLFLNPLGVTWTKAFALGILVYGLNLLVSLLGAPAFAVGGKKRVVASPSP